MRGDISPCDFSGPTDKKLRNNGVTGNNNLFFDIRDGVHSGFGLLVYMDGDTILSATGHKRGVKFHIIWRFNLGNSSFSYYFLLSAGRFPRTFQR